MKHRHSLSAASWLLVAACTSKSPAPAVTTGSSLAVTDSARAVAAVTAVLDLARVGRYDSAMALYADDWRPMARHTFDNGANVDSMGAGGFLGAVCKSGYLFCDLSIRRIVSVAWPSPDTAIVTMELSNKDGSRFEPPPCCGTEGDADTLFQFEAVRTSAGFRSLSLPVYRP